MCVLGTAGELLYGTASGAPLQAMRGALRCAGAGASRTWPSAALAACDEEGFAWPGCHKHATLG